MPSLEAHPTVAVRGGAQATVLTEASDLKDVLTVAQGQAQVPRDRRRQRLEVSEVHLTATG